MQHRLMRRAAGLALGLTLATLMGCAGTNRLQAEVSTHPQWPAGIPTGQPAYQWDRLPSLRSGPQARDQTLWKPRPTWPWRKRVALWTPHKPSGACSLKAKPNARPHRSRAV